MRVEANLKKQNDGQLNLYRAMRMQNKDNSFLYYDHLLKQFYYVEIKINILISLSSSPKIIQHTSQKTLPHNELLKTFWKIITTHYFKKIDQEEWYKFNYLQLLFKNIQLPTNIIDAFNIPQEAGQKFIRFLSSVFSDQVLQKVINDQFSVEEGIWIKKMLVVWASDMPRFHKKTKMIEKQSSVKKKQKKMKNLKINQLKQIDNELNNLIKQIDFRTTPIKIDQSKQCDNLDDEIERLQSILSQNHTQNQILLQRLQNKIREQQQIMHQKQQMQRNGEDAACLQWLTHRLEEKQIAESVTKIMRAQKIAGEMKFSVEFQQAMNIVPQIVNQSELGRINLLRQVSLLKFYRTGVKSIYSFACHNYVGLTDMLQNRMGISKSKDKDYLLALKKGNHVNPEVKKQIDQFDICHHCKYIYPDYLLTTCKFISDRQSMPKTSQVQADFQSQLNLQKGRISQRFLLKHKNCFTGYSKINDEYICNRKYCKACIKDCYGEDWMKNNNGLCPFCQGICSCTRCIRNEKINKLKTFFIGLGGDLNILQQNSPIEKLPIKKDGIITKTKAKFKKMIPYKPIKVTNKKTKKINKAIWRKPSNKPISISNKKISRSKLVQYQQMLQQQTQKWSSTAQKQLRAPFIRLSKRRISTRVY